MAFSLSGRSAPSVARPATGRARRKQTLSPADRPALRTVGRVAAGKLAQLSAWSSVSRSGRSRTKCGRRAEQQQQAAPGAAGHERGHSVAAAELRVHFGCPRGAARAARLCVRRLVVGHLVFVLVDVVVALGRRAQSLQKRRAPDANRKVSSFSLTVKLGSCCTLRRLLPNKPAAPDLTTGTRANGPRRPNKTTAFLLHARVSQQ